MRKVWVVVRREFTEKVRNKWFIISTLVVPVLMAAVVVLPILLAERGGGHRSIAVLDLTTSDFGENVAQRLDAVDRLTASLVEVELVDLESAADSLTGLVGLKRLDGYLLVSDETVEDGRAEYRGSNISSLTDMQSMERRLRQAVLVERLERVGVDPSLVERAQIPVNMETVGIRGGELTDESGEARFFFAYTVWFVLYIAILVYGVQVMGAVVEEKTSRIIEVLVSSLRPFQLLAGKVLGVGAVGLFQFMIWGVSAWALIRHRDVVLGVLGISAPTGSGFRLPEVTAGTLAIIVTFFLLGYFLYAAMFAAVAAMSSSEAEARQAQTPVVMLLVLPSVLLIGILQQPDSTLALTLSIVPFSSPIAMPVRWAAAEVPPVEVAASVGALVVTLWLVTWIAARIYRVGILMYGKRPNIKELVRWVRTP
jgi:ABC-2 type transport system permease protein